MTSSIRLYQNQFAFYLRLLIELKLFPVVGLEDFAYHG